MTRKKLTLQNIVLILALAGTLLAGIREWYWMKFEIQAIQADMEFVKDLLIKIADSQ